MLRGRTEVDENRKDLVVASIREIDINYQIMDVTGKAKRNEIRDKTIRTFEVHDAEFSDLSSGKYKYRIELEINDAAKSIVQAMIAAMTVKRQNFVNYIDFIENNHKFYNGRSRRFTKEFREVYKHNYANISEASKSSEVQPPNQDIVRAYFKALSLFFNDDILTNQTIRAAMLMTSHEYGSLDMCKEFLKLYDSLLGRLQNMANFLGYDKSVEPHTFDSQETPSILAISETLTNCVSANELPKTGLIYLSGYEKQQAVSELPSVSKEEIISHFQTQKESITPT